MILFTTVTLFARPVVMLTGYWPPTSEMIHRFSNNPELNPDGWIGENWEGRGYDVYAFFPAFDIATREFEVDYQATWTDFWARVEEYHPEIIISFGAGAGPWEIETRAKNLSNWMPDEVLPYYPTPNPPDSTLAVNEYRYASLPLDAIMAAIDEQTNINAWIDSNGDPGNFLCNYIAYLGMWYQNMHADANDEYFCRGAGFIHLDGTIPVNAATEAAEITLRATLEYYASLADLNGCIIADNELGGAEIVLINESGIEFSATTNDVGDFTIAGIPYNNYSVEASLGRYFYYQGEFEFSEDNTFLQIEMEAFSFLNPVTYSQGATELINFDEEMFVFVGAYFPTEILENYTNCHLNRFYFTAPGSSEDCSMQLKLYRGTPMIDNIQLIQNISLPEFSEGDFVEAWLDDFYILSEEDIAEGLTLTYWIINTSYNIGYTDNTIANPNGNLIKVGQNWYHADTEFNISGNWDIALGFNGELVNSSDENLEIINHDLSNYPNPFNPNTTISFNATAENISNVKIEIFNVRGQQIENLEIGNLKKGRNEIVWNAENFASGIYLYKLIVNGKIEAVKKCLLLK